jgi:hypothetical protein
MDRDILTLGACNLRTSLTVARMPSEEPNAMKERVKFVLEWEKQRGGWPSDTFF